MKKINWGTAALTVLAGITTVTSITNSVRLEDLKTERSQLEQLVKVEQTIDAVTQAYEINGKVYAQDAKGDITLLEESIEGRYGNKAGYSARQISDNEILLEKDGAATWLYSQDRTHYEIKLE